MGAIVFQEMAKSFVFVCSPPNDGLGKLRGKTRRGRGKGWRGGGQQPLPACVKKGTYIEKQLLLIRIHPAGQEIPWEEKERRRGDFFLQLRTTRSGSGLVSKNQMLRQRQAKTVWIEKGGRGGEDHGHMTTEMVQWS